MLLPIEITHEMTDDIVHAKGLIDIKTGIISQVEYVDYDVVKSLSPRLRSDYEFTSGLLPLDEREIEFAIEVLANEASPQQSNYRVTPLELEEIQEKSQKLLSQSTAKTKKRPT